MSSRYIGRCHSQEAFDRLSKGICHVLNERVERIPECSLANQLECHATGPLRNVDLFGIGAKLLD